MKTDQVLWDALIPGLHIRAGKRTKSFLYYYKALSGKERRPKIGNYGVLTIQDAREIARTWALDIANGGDPMLDKNNLRKAGPPKTLKDLKQRWDEELEKAQKVREAILKNAQTEISRISRLPNKKKRRKPLGELKPSTINAYKLAWKYLIKKFGDSYELDCFTTEQLDEWMDELAVSHGVTTANRTMAHFSGLIGWAMDWRMRDRSLGNPAQGVGRFEEFPRRRIIRPEEGPRFKAALNKWLVSEDPGERKIARLFVLCLYNSNRRSEFLNARLSWMDWDTGKLLLPDSKIDQVEIILGEQCLEVLIARYEEWEKEGANPDHDWVIPGRYPNRPLKEPKKLWKAFLKEAGVEGFNLHDLRRSFASIGLSSLSFGLDHMGQIMKHKNPQTTKRYAYMMDHAQRAILNKTGEQITGLLNGRHHYINQKVPSSIREERAQIRRNANYL